MAPNSNSRTADIVVIGGGAAGMFFAALAAQRGFRVVLIERNRQFGRKIIISGGGRCNFTNTGTAPENFVSRNPHFCKSALSRYGPEEFIELVEKHRIPFYEKKLGQLFCRNRSKDIVEMLLEECEKAGVTLITGCEVRTVEKNSHFRIETSTGTFEAERLVIATGGLSFPKIGATDFGYRVARDLGHRLIEVCPSLVPLRFRDDDFSSLSGISVEVLARAGKSEFRENILFTHRGLSGPAVLQVSNYWDQDKAVEFDLLPGRSLGSVLDSAPDKKLKNVLSTELPERVVTEFVPAKLSEVRTKALGEGDREALRKMLKGWRVFFSDTEGWHKAEVTKGGVDTDQLSSRTMESRLVEGLYFIGEVVDVTGWLGGYNFQWAWSSAYACASEI